MSTESKSICYFWYRHTSSSDIASWHCKLPNTGKVKYNPKCLKWKSFVLQSIIIFPYLTRACAFLIRVLETN